MRVGPVALLLITSMSTACGQAPTPEAPTPPPPEAGAEADHAPETPAAAVEPTPTDPLEGISRDADLSGMTEEEQQHVLMALGEKVYLTGDGGLACVTCHQKGGEGVPGAFPPLVGQADWMGDCAHHATLILDGLQGPITVNDVPYNGVMVPQGKLLNDLQIAAVTSYVRQSWGNDYGFCSPADVKAARAQ